MRTQRGFEVFTAFPDSHGSLVRVQESSSFERVWVFSERPKDTDDDGLQGGIAKRMLR